MSEILLYTVSSGKRHAELSITHIFCCQLEADGDVGEACHAAPEYCVAGWAVGCAIEIPAGTGELQQRGLQ